MGGRWVGDVWKEIKKAESPRLDCFHNRKIFIVICFKAKLRQFFDISYTIKVVFFKKSAFTKL